MSGGADSGRAGLPDGWGRLERSAEEAALALSRWKARAAEAEAEVRRLRDALEEHARDREGTAADADLEVRRLKAENAALVSRMQQARKRVSGLMARLSALEIEP